MRERGNDCIPGVSQRYGRANYETGRIASHLLELRDLAHVNDRRQIAQLLRYPETNIRAAGQDQRAGFALERRGEFIEAARRIKVRKLKGMVAPDRTQRISADGRVRRVPAPMRRRRIATHAAARFNDGAVAGAAA